MSTYTISTETADLVREWGKSRGMTPAAPKMVGPGIEEVTLPPFAAMSFAMIVAVEGTADAAARAVINR